MLRGFKLIGLDTFAMLQYVTSDADAHLMRLKLIGDSVHYVNSAASACGHATSGRGSSAASVATSGY